MPKLVSTMIPSQSSRCVFAAKVCLLVAGECGQPRAVHALQLPQADTPRGSRVPILLAMGIPLQEIPVTCTSCCHALSHGMAFMATVPKDQAPKALALQTPVKWISSAKAYPGIVDPASNATSA